MVIFVAVNWGFGRTRITIKRRGRFWGSGVIKVSMQIEGPAEPRMANAILGPTPVAYRECASLIALPLMQLRVKGL